MVYKRTNLKIFRIRQNMTQLEFASYIDCERSGYSLIENGLRHPSVDFFYKLQEAFNVPDEEMWELTKLDKK